jgi:hypothetical protein
MISSPAVRGAQRIQAGSARGGETDVDEPVVVKMSRICMERMHDFGDVWLACGLWRMLELDELL